jgi:Putative beta-barrel porin 2
MRPFAKTDFTRWAGLANVGLCSCAGFALAVVAIPTRAETELTPYASVSYAYQSNPFYQWGGTSVPITASDSLVRLVGGADLRFVKSRQSFTANAEVRRFEYDRFNELTRTEHSLSGAYDWTPTPNTTVGATYRHERRLVPLEELANVHEPLIEREDVLAASLAQRIAAAWGLESRVQARDLASPRPGVPDLDLHENSLHETLRRALGSVSVGADFEYLSGSYHGAGILDARDYRQVTLQLAAERAIADFSTVECALGYTKRDDRPNGGGISTVTGFARYQRSLTGKTSADVFVRRSVNSYISTVSSEIDTVIGASATWRPTVKLATIVTAAFTRSDFSGSSRRDDYQALTLQIQYQVLQSLALSPYARYASRTSNVHTFGFNASEFGIELVLREPR